MYRLIAGLLAFLMFSGLAWAEKQTDWPLMPDSKETPGVPKGEVLGPFPFKSSVFPGSEREFWLYVPAQYDGSQPAATMVVQDGVGLGERWHLFNVMDNLIHKQEMPMTIAIFVRWGTTPAANKDAWGRINRSFEYDSLSDRYAKMLIEEIIPHVEKDYRLIDDPSARLIAGSSSGGIAAFNVAWARPDFFGRVMTGVGTYVGLRGANELSVLVRKQETKPIKVFLQDGEHDLNIYCGNWWLANLQMYEALKWAGYEVNHSWDKGGHGHKGLMAVLPKAMRWIWQGFPSPIKKPHASKRKFAFNLHENQWQAVKLGAYPVKAIASDSNGDLIYATEQGVFKYKDTKSELLSNKLKSVNAIALSPSGTIFVAQKKKNQIASLSKNGKRKVVVKKVKASHLTASENGLYFSETENHRVGFYNFETKKTSYYSDIQFPTGLTLSSEKSFLTVNRLHGPLSYSYKIENDGTLNFGQDYHYFHRPYLKNTIDGQGLTVDTNNRIFAATNYGIQAVDQLGRVHVIIDAPLNSETNRLSKPKMLSKPNILSKSNLSQLTFGGSDNKELFGLQAGKVFKRNIESQGLASDSLGVKPPKPRL